MEKKVSLYDIIIVGLMAAVVFAVTMFLSIRIPTPTGTTMIKLAGAFCLLAGILLGGWRGGLAAGLGSMFFDLLSPEYMSEAWITFIRFFLMAYICGKIAYFARADGRRPLQNGIAYVIASLFSTLFYIAKGILTLMLAGSAFTPAFLAEIPKLATSSLNMVISVVVAIVLTPVLRRALASSAFYQKVHARL